MHVFLCICAGLILVCLFTMVVVLSSIDECLRALMLRLPPERTTRVRMPWESDGSNFNIARPGGTFPDQM